MKNKIKNVKYIRLRWFAKNAFGAISADFLDLISHAEIVFDLVRYHDKKTDDTVDACSWRDLKYPNI